MMKAFANPNGSVILHSPPPALLLTQPETSPGHLLPGQTLRAHPPADTALQALLSCGQPLAAAVWCAWSKAGSQPELHGVLHLPMLIYLLLAQGSAPEASTAAFAITY